MENQSSFDKTIKQVLEEKNEDLYKLLNPIWISAKKEIHPFQESSGLSKSGGEHCEEVEKIVDKIVPNKYKEKLEPIELFILSASVCLHDVGKSDRNAKDHGLKAMKSITENYSYYSLTKPQGMVIGQIVGAHNDKERFEKLEQTCNIDLVDIRMKELAAILRLADALHTYSSRISLNPDRQEGKKVQDWERFRQIVYGFKVEKSNEIIFNIVPDREEDNEIIEKGIKALNEEIEPVRTILSDLNIPNKIVTNINKTRINITNQKKEGIIPNWLNPNLGKELNDLREKLSKFYKDNLDEYEGQDSKKPPFFIDSDPEHWKGVEEYIHELIPKDYCKEFITEERFYLLAASQLHDIGMLPSIVEDVDSERYFHENRPIESLIRDEHHIISAKYIVKDRDFLNLNEKDAQILSNIVKFHRKIMDLDELQEEQPGRNGKKIRVRLLAAYLRLADSLDAKSSYIKNEDFRVLIAYEMPYDTKIHWIKSMLIGDILIDPKKKSIKIYFMDDDSGTLRLGDLHKLIIKDFNDELSSVLPALVPYNVPYYIAFEGEKYCVTIESERIKELSDLIVNFNTIMEQSASNLFEMILISISNIVGFKLSSDETQNIIDLNLKEIKEIKGNLISKKQKLCDFLHSIDEKVLNLRNCHFGLRNLIKISKSLVDTHFSANNLKHFITEINKYNIFFRKSKQVIGMNSIHFIEEELADLFNSKKQVQFYFNILLYGFSNLVITALTSFKNYIEINNPKAIFRIFICEGSSKTQIGTYNSLTYHDGSSYSLALKRQGFDNLILIPDSTVDNIVESQSIKLIMIGANGFTENYFKHSAGHAPSIKIARFRKEVGKKEWPKSVLIVSSLKFLDSEKVKVYDENKMENNSGITKELRGCYFWQDEQDTPVREHVWFLKDKKRMKELHENKIYLYNPREDNIQLTLLDYIISDVGYFSNNKKKQNFNIFISKTKDYLEENKLFVQDIKENGVQM